MGSLPYLEGSLDSKITIKYMLKSMFYHMLYPFWVQYHYLKSNNLNIIWNLPEFLFLRLNILFPN